MRRIVIIPAVVTALASISSVGFAQNAQTTAAPGAAGPTQAAAPGAPQAPGAPAAGPATTGAGAGAATAVPNPAGAATTTPQYSAVPAGETVSPGAPAYTPSSHPATAREGVWRLIAPEEPENADTDPDRPHGWFRMDTDVQKTHFWVGGSFRLADGIAFAPFAHVLGSVAEPDAAVTFNAGSLWVMPAFGVGFDFATTDAVYLAPQVFAALDLKFVYFETWDQMFLGSALHDAGTDTFYTRDMLLAVVSRIFAVGPQVEATWTLRSSPAGSLLSAPVGGRVNLRIGRYNTVGLFLGYETKAQARGVNGAGDGIAGRFEYVHQW